MNIHSPVIIYNFIAHIFDFSWSIQAEASFTI